MSPGRRIREAIETRIRSGEWKPGHRLPFEHELVAQYGCSRATVSKAMGALAAAGLIERRRKAGSFVAHPHLQAAAIDVPDIARIVADRGEAYRWDLRECRIAAAADMAEADHGVGEQLYVSGVHYAGGEPFALESRLIVLAAVPDARDADFAGEAPGSWLLDHVPWSEARHHISAVGAGRAEAKLLGIAAGTPCLRLDRRTWRGGALVTQVRQLFPGERYSLTAQFGHA